MSSNDVYLESMLTDLGSVYYQTLHGEATQEDVAKAVESVRWHQENAGPGGSQASHDAADGGRPAAVLPGPHSGKWRVADVMAADVLTIDKNMPYKQIVRLLAENDLSAIPVVSGGGHVLGMVSEADVLRKEERYFGRLGSGLPHRTHHERKQAEALTAEGLMSSPVITIHPDAPLGAAARLMNGHRIRRLPVVSPARELIGMVTRRDLLSVFLRPDGEIAAEINEEFARRLPAGGPVRIIMSVADGEVRLAGVVPTPDMIGQAVRIASSVDGVVEVASRLTTS